MKTLSCCAMIIALVSLVGCLPFGLGDPEKSNADDKLVGIWLSELKDGQQSVWVVSPYDSRTMLATFYGFKRNGDAIEPDERGNYKLWITPIGGKQFFTLAATGTGAMMKADESTFMSAEFEIAANKINVRGINADTIKKANIDSGEAFTRYVTDHIGDTDLYIDALTYEKVAKDNEDLVKILKAFHE